MRQKQHVQQTGGQLYSKKLDEVKMITLLLKVHRSLEVTLVKLMKEFSSKQWNNTTEIIFGRPFVNRKASIR